MDLLPKDAELFYIPIMAQFAGHLIGSKYKSNYTDVTAALQSFKSMVGRDNIWRMIEQLIIEEFITVTTFPLPYGGCGNRIYVNTRNPFTHRTNSHYAANAAQIELIVSMVSH